MDCKKIGLMEKLFADYDILEIKVTCRNCRKEFLVFSTEYSEVPDLESYFCPFCGAELGDIRADRGYVTVGYRELTDSDTKIRKSSTEKQQ